MIATKDIIKRLILHEGVRLKPYRCSKNKLTIGVGRNLQDNPLSIEEKEFLHRADVTNGITKEEALYLLKNDIKKHLTECHKNIPFFYELSDERQYALLDMCFNLGIRGLLKFKKMLYCLSIGDCKGASKECLNSQYAKEVGIRAVRIARLLQDDEWRI